MNAQEEWKEAWRNKEILMFDRHERHEMICYGWADVIIRAALERKLEAAQREIEAWRKHNADAIELIDLLRAEREAFTEIVLSVKPVGTPAEKACAIYHVERIVRAIRARDARPGA
jgi:hypothetical protein